MSLHPHHQDNAVSPQSGAATPEGLLSAIEDLAKNAKENVKSSRRDNERMTLNSPAELIPGNVSGRDGRVYSGSCRDISNRGCRLILTQPLIVGDIYLMSVENQELGLDPSFGRCVRCHMIREDAFEVGLNFLSPVSFSETTQDDALSLDLNIG